PSLRWITRAEIAFGGPSEMSSIATSLPRPSYSGPPQKRESSVRVPPTVRMSPFTAASETPTTTTASSSTPIATSGSPSAGVSVESGGASRAAASAGSARMARSRSGAPAITCAAIGSPPATTTWTSCNGISFPAGEGRATACSVVTASACPSKVPVPCVTLSVMAVPPSAGTETLPLASITVECSLSATDVRAPTGARRARARILNREDFAGSPEMYVQFLPAPGFRVTGAEDGIAALRSIGSAIPGLVVLDVALPKLDGLSVLRRLRSDPRFASLPVLTLSASLGADYQRIAMAAGGDAGSDADVATQRWQQRRSPHGRPAAVRSAR